MGLPWETIPPWLNFRVFFILQVLECPYSMEKNSEPSNSVSIFSLLASLKQNRNKMIVKQIFLHTWFVLNFMRTYLAIYYKVWDLKLTLFGTKDELKK